MSTPYLGEIRIFGFNFAPQGWAMCQGQLLPIQQNAALFSLIGTYYGGNGVQTFALPDLRSRVAVNQGQGPGLSEYVIGQESGVENVTLLQNNMPQHTHAVNCNSGAGTTAVPTGDFWAEVNGGGRTPVTYPAYATSANAQMAATAIGTAGGSQPFSVLQPYLAVNFCIALTGIFPTRG